jgi:hypothetical protein
MANYADKHYFKRSGDSFYMCEHFDILDIFSRKVSPKLQLEYKVIPRQKTFQNCFKYCVLLSITNHSNVAARFPYLGLTTSNIFFPDEFGIDGNGHTGLIKVFNNTSYEHNYIGGSERIIYPKSKLDVNYFISKIPYDKPPPSLNISYIISAENASTLEGKIEIKSDEFE